MGSEWGVGGDGELGAPSGEWGEVGSK